MNNNYQIKDYALLGDLHTAALISNNGSVDWLCLPHFDSPSIFAKLLDPVGGFFRVDVEDYEVKSKYLDYMPIVEFNLKKIENEVRIRDFMVPQPKNMCDSHFLVRKITGLKGKASLNFILHLRPSYGRKNVNLQKKGSVLYANLINHKIFIHLPIGTKVKKIDQHYNIEIEINEDETKELILEYSTNLKSYYNGGDFEKITINFWKKWISRGKFGSFYKEQKIRSAITLKLLQFYPTGALIAAPTTSIPEKIGGKRNWDYRYTWIRDATFTLYAFYILGYKEELMKFFNFIELISKGCIECNNKIHLMYTINGKHPPLEQNLNHMIGYKKSQPVRIGNDAFNQFQLDVYGSLIDAYYFMWRRNLEISKRGKELILSLVNKIADTWKKPDNGIWEVRSGKEQFTYSKVMAWVGVNRTLKMKEILPINEKRRKDLASLEKNIKQWIWDNCYNDKIKSFTQHPKTRYQDATNFLFVLLQFLDRHDEKTKLIIKNTCKELCYKDIFVYRYLSEDGFPGKEGAFVLSTFWLIASLSAVANINKASAIYSKFQKYMNKYSLLSEEIDPNNQEYLGNYPQAFSHMGLILALYYIEKYGKK